MREMRIYGLGLAFDGNGLGKRVEFTRIHGDGAVTVRNGFDADETTPLPLAQITHRIAVAFTRIPHHGLRRTLFGDDDGAAQRIITQTKGVRRIVDAINQTGEGDRLIP